MRPPYQNSPNRSSGLSVQGVVIHRTYGGYDGAVSWLKNPQSGSSAHFVVAQDGRAVQLVPLPDPDTVGPRDGRYKAWHCKDGNSRYVGIEHEGSDDDPPTEKMLVTSAAISALVCGLYKVPIKFGPSSLTAREFFTGFGAHANVPGNDHTDGRPWPWDHYLDLVRGGGDELTNEDLKKIEKIVEDTVLRALGVVLTGEDNAQFRWPEDWGNKPKQVKATQHFQG